MPSTARPRGERRTFWEHIMDGGSVFDDRRIMSSYTTRPTLAPPLPQHVLALKPRPRHQPRVLRDEDIQFFMTYGYLKVPECLTRLQCEATMGDLWQRMGVTPDKKTWQSERIDVPGRQDLSVQTYAPTVWNVMCDLLGGEDRISESCHTWDDGLIVNLGTPEGEGNVVAGQDLDGWHIDGDWFARFLDSPEQALLMIPLFTDIEPHAGGTAMCPSGIAEVANFMYYHPEGVSPNLVPRAEDPQWNRKPSRWRIDEIIRRMPPESFVEATGKAGDVYFVHPFMPHSSSNNALRRLRVISNPGASLKEPFNYDRADGNYSIVERTTLHHLGRDRIPDWRIFGTRDLIDSEREQEERLKRLQETKPKYGPGAHTAPPG